MRFLKCALALFIAALAAPQAMACFTVYNRTNLPVYSGMEPPIDMSYQIHERLPAAFPDGHLVFGSSSDCPAIDTRKVSPVLSNVNVATAATAPSGRTSRSTASGAAARKPPAETPQK
jgi:hypothetical protein